MPLSVPNNPPTVNEAVAKGVSTGHVIDIDESQTKINQIHGIATQGAIGAGIPKQVFNVQVSIANASTGTTCTASIVYKSDPTDSSLSGVKVWVKGYNGNSNPVLVGSGTSSPTKIVLNNTGETVTFVIQAFGNGGTAPISQSPSCSGTLPKSTSGGFGSSTATGTSVTGIVGQLALIGSGSVNGGNLTGDVTTNNTPACTVVGFQGVPIISNAPIDGSVFRYSAEDGNYQEDFIWDWRFELLSGSALPTIGIGTPWLVAPGSTGIFGTQGNFSVVNSASLLPGIKFLSSGTSGSQQIYWASNSGAGVTPPFNAFRRVRFILSIGQTTNSRFFFGIGDQVSNVNFVQDNPSQNFVGFRYSAGVDSSWAAYSSTSNVAFTATATGVAVTTGVTTFDFVYLPGSKVLYYINGALVATITTNLPASSVKVNVIIAGDNKGTGSGNTVSFVWYTVKGTLGRAFR